MIKIILAILLLSAIHSQIFPFSASKFVAAADTAIISRIPAGLFTSADCF